MSLPLPGTLGPAEVDVEVDFCRRNGRLRVTRPLDEAAAAGTVVFLKKTSPGHPIRYPHAAAPVANRPPPAVARERAP
jgi:hypothetical protein